MTTDVPYPLGDEPFGGSGTTMPAIGPISITDDQVIDVMVAFLAVVLPGVSVSRGQLNRVPEPIGPNYVILTPLRRTNLATTKHTEDPDADTVTVGRSTAFDLQIDMYGPSSTDNAQVFTTLFRDAYGCRAMDGTGVQPLYCDDGRQMPLVDGEAQYEDRWVIAASLQIIPTVSTPAQFADSVDVSIVEAD